MLFSWLLCDAEMNVRSVCQPFLDAVDSYLTALVVQVGQLQVLRLMTLMCCHLLCFEANAESIAV